MNWSKDVFMSFLLWAIRKRLEQLSFENSKNMQKIEGDKKSACKKVLKNWRLTCEILAKVS